MNLFRVANLPRPARGAVVVCERLAGGVELGLPGAEGVAVVVLGRADGGVGGNGVDHEDGVPWPVDVGVDAQAEEVLVVVGVDARVDLCSPALRVFAGVHTVGVEDAGELDLGLDRAVLLFRAC